MIKMPIQYVKSSLKKVADNILQFEIKNTEGSAKVNITPSIYIDGKDVTSGTSISIKGNEFSKAKENMDLDILFGESITLRCELDRPIEPGNHKIKVEIKVNWPIWTTFNLEFNAKIT